MLELLRSLRAREEGGGVTPATGDRECMPFFSSSLMFGSSQKSSEALTLSRIFKKLDQILSFAHLPPLILIVSRYLFFSSTAISALVVAVRRLKDETWIDKTTRNRIIYLITDGRTKFDNSNVSDIFEQFAPDPLGRLSRDKNGIILKVV